MAGVFDDDAHAVMAVVVGEVAHDPDAGVVHLDDGGDAFGGAEPEDGDGGGSGDGVAVEGDDFEGVAEEREAADLGGAGVDDVEEDTLAGFDADGLAVAEHLAVDGEGGVADLVAVGHSAGERGFHGGLACVFDRFDGGGGGEEVHGHVSAAAEGWLELFEGEEDFAVVGAGVVGGLDVDGTGEAVVLTGGEVGSGADVGVIEADAGGTRSELDAACAVGGDVGGAFFGCAVYVGGNELAVPVELLGDVGVVVDVDGDGLALFEAEERAGELAVVSGGGDDAVGREFNGAGGDAEGVVGWGGGLLGCDWRRREVEGFRGFGERGCCGGSGELEEVAARCAHVCWPRLRSSRSCPLCVRGSQRYWQSIAVWADRSMKWRVGEG